MFSKKSCVICAFCLHCRDTFYGFPNPRWDNQMDNLTDNEIIQLKNGDISFLSEDKRKHDEWIATYEEKKEERRKKIEESRKKGSFMVGALFGEDFLASISEMRSVSLLPGSNPYPLREEFGMEPCPIAPDYEYLKCWKEVWGKGDENVWSTLRSKRCANYYPLSKKETKTLKACDEERKEKADNKKYWRGVIVGFISASIVMLMRFLIAPYFNSTNNEVDNYPTQQEQAESREIQPTNEGNDNNSNVNAEENTNQEINKGETEANNTKHRHSESEK